MLDGSGNIYVTGYFSGTVDFDPGLGTSFLTSTGSGDMFIIKLNNSGDLVWAQGIGGEVKTILADVILDGDGNLYLTGQFRDIVDFDPGAGINNMTSAGGADIFVSKFDTAGNFLWAKSMGGASDDEGYEIVLDNGGNVYATGTYSGTADFDPGIGITNLTSAGGNDIFVSKLDANGNFVWARSMGGTSSDEGNDIVLDSSGNIYTIGDYHGTADFDPGAGTSNQPVWDHPIFLSVSWTVMEILFG